jgi:hypothetical protein
MSSPNAEMSATIDRIARRFRRSPDIREVWERIRYRLVGTPDRKAKLLKRVKIGGPILLIGLGVALYFILRPVPQPDYKKARLDKIFNYTLLTDEFNKLPVEKRLELIGQLVQRLQGMSAGDSAILAGFAAGIAGAARKQIEENGARLAIDMWDKYARDYGRVKPEDRGAFLDQAFLEFSKTMETVGGQPRNVSDTQRLQEVHEQAKRDLDQIHSGKFNPPEKFLGNAFGFVRDNIGDHASIAQKTRGQQMMRDMVRRMRGEDVGGGK